MTVYFNTSGIQPPTSFVNTVAKYSLKTSAISLLPGIRGTKSADAYTETTQKTINIH